MIPEELMKAIESSVKKHGRNKVALIVDESLPLSFIRKMENIGVLAMYRNDRDRANSMLCGVRLKEVFCYGQCEGYVQKYVMYKLDTRDKSMAAIHTYFGGM